MPIQPPGVRPTRRQFLQFGALAGAAMGGLSGCSSDSGATKLTFLQNKPEVIPYFDKLTQQFNHSHRSIQAKHNSAAIPLTPMFVRGNPPDLAAYNFQLEAASFLSRGALTDLADLPEAKTIMPSAQDLVNQYATWKGQTCALPYAIASAGVIYNKDLFAKHDVDVPTTWDEMIAACKKFQAAGVTPIMFTFMDPWTLTQGVFDYCVGGMLDVKDFFKKLDAAKGDVSPSSPESFSKNYHDACAKMIELFKYRNRNAQSLGYNAGNTAFAQGKSAMYFQGPWALTPLSAAAPKMKLGTFALPLTNDKKDTKVRVNLDLALWIPTDSPHQDEARVMLKWLMQPEIMNAYNASALTTSPTKNAPQLADDRVSALAPYIKSSRFYNGAESKISMTIPLGNYLQTMLTSGDITGFLRKLDTDWANRAQRDAAA